MMQMKPSLLKSISLYSAYILELFPSTNYLLVNFLLKLMRRPSIIQQLSSSLRSTSPFLKDQTLKYPEPSEMRLLLLSKNTLVSVLDRRFRVIV